MGRREQSADLRQSTAQAAEHNNTHITLNITFKGLLHPKIIILSFFTYPHVVPNPQKICSSSELFFYIFWMKTGRLVTVQLTDT